MEINYSWFGEQEEDLEVDTSFKRIFYCNLLNDSLLEFQHNPKGAEQIIINNVVVTSAVEIDDYPRPRSPQEYYVNKVSCTMPTNAEILNKPKPPPVPVEKLVPEHYHDFLSVFDEKISKQIPE